MTRLRTLIILRVPSSSVSCSCKQSYLAYSISFLTSLSRLLLAVLLHELLPQSSHPVRSSNLDSFMTYLRRGQCSLVAREMVWYVVAYVVLILNRSVDHLRKAILTKLKEKACQVYSQYRAGNPASNEIPVADELTLFGGRTRVLVSKLLSSRSSKVSKSEPTSQDPPTQSSSDSDSTFATAEQSPDVHPALMEYLSTFLGDESNTSHLPDFDHQYDFAMLSASQQQEYIAPEHQNGQSYWQPPSSSPAPQSTSYVDPFTSFVLQPEFGAQSRINLGNFFDLGMMFTETDEQWKSFVRDTSLET